MQAVIPGKNVRLFAKMISCLQKIGEDLFIEGTANKVNRRKIIYIIKINTRSLY